MNAIESTEHYKDRIKVELNNTLTETSLPSGDKRAGKVRDQYALGNKIALITTDRQSAFDRVLASIPFKGQVLNLTSAWWFEQTKGIINNHVIGVPDPNVTLAKKCNVFPIEFVVRVTSPAAPVLHSGPSIIKEIVNIAVMFFLKD